jgi:uncharacterized protein YbcI
MAENLKQPTRGQLERTLSQQLQKLYRDNLGHATGKVSCRLFEDKLTIVVEDSLTQPEQLLLQETDAQRVEQLRSDLDEAVRPKLISLIEDILDCKVLDLMSDTTLETGRTGFVIVLAEQATSCTKDTQAAGIARASERQS